MATNKRLIAVEHTNERLIAPGLVAVERTNEFGRLHSPNSGTPAVEVWRTVGVGHARSAVLLQWFADGVLHRDGDVPAQIETFRDGAFKMSWYRDGVLHRDGDLPAVAYYGSYQEAQWWVNGKRHRIGDKPAQMLIDHDTHLWFHNGRLHRTSGPAITHRGQDRGWFIHGQRVAPLID